MTPLRSVAAWVPPGSSFRQAMRESESSRRHTATSWIPAFAGMTIHLNDKFGMRRTWFGCFRIKVGGLHINDSVHVFDTAPGDQHAIAAKLAKEFTTSRRHLKSAHFGLV